MDNSDKINAWLAISYVALGAICFAIGYSVGAG